MAYILAYTKRGETYYNSGNPQNYPEQQGLNCDLFDAVHLALSRDGRTYIPLRNDTGILFPRADFSKNIPGGITKTLVDPWLFRMADGSFGVCAVRRNQNAPDPDSLGSAMIFRSKDLIRYEEAGFLKLGDAEIRRPKCRYDEKNNTYCVEWECGGKLFGGRTADLRSMDVIGSCEKSGFEKGGFAREGCSMAGETAGAAVVASTGEMAGAAAADGCRIPNVVPGNVLEISEDEAAQLEAYLGEIRSVYVEQPVLRVKAGDVPEFEKLPKALCGYSDGSVHEKAVAWDRETFEKIGFDRPGEYEICGEIVQKHYPFPFMEAVISDPCICRYGDRYFLSGSGQRSVAFRVSSSLEGLAQAEPFDIYRLPDEDRIHANMWAPEMHVIRGVPYVFTTVGEQSWSTVRSHVLRCKGDPENPDDWEEPRLVLRPNGEELQDKGISLDMTYFCVNDVHYVMWSDRIFAERTAERLRPDSADICIATIDPDAPWQLLTEPVRILRPMYGWDRCETEVDEGPYLLRHGDDLFVTISGSSTGLADLYCLGLLHAKAGADLLNPESWDWLPYPVLTKESVPGEYGPGHNCFIKDPDSGDDLLIYHAVPHDEENRELGRHMGIRRVHWAANGYPYLEMTEERDVAEELRKVVLKICVE